MSVTEHLLTCIKNHVLSDVAKLGGGINLDIATQKNKQVWCCLASRSYNGPSRPPNWTPWPECTLPVLPPPTFMWPLFDIKVGPNFLVKSPQQKVERAKLAKKLKVFSHRMSGTKK